MREMIALITLAALITPQFDIKTIMNGTLMKKRKRKKDMKRARRDR